MEKKESDVVLFFVDGVLIPVWFRPSIIARFASGECEVNIDGRRFLFKQVRRWQALASFRYGRLIAGE